MDIEVIDYLPVYQADFKRLNLEWICKYFEVEGPDLQQLDHPEEFILSKGGKIYFARSVDRIVGTITLKRDNDTVFELSKMAVAPDFQGRGVGRILAEHLIDEARNMGCRRLFLESNQKLLPALNLYKKLGFIEVPIGASPYSRADFRAEMCLD